MKLTFEVDPAVAPELFVVAVTMETVIAVEMHLLAPKKRFQIIFIFFNIFSLDHVAYLCLSCVCIELETHT